jgi:uncharacterized protein YfaS (alpha-2-macroglobulin family)
MKRFAAFLIAGSLVLVSAFLLRSFLLAQSRTSDPTAIYTHGVLRVSIPYTAPHSGEGDLAIEVLDPEDRVVSGIDRHIFIDSGRGTREQDVAIRGALPIDDLVWHRLRYRFRYNVDSADAFDGITSISRILRRPVVHVLGQESYLSGSAAAVRLIVTQADNETLVTSGSLRIELAAPGGKPQTVYSGKLNERGTTRADFRFPAGLAGKLSLHYIADTDSGDADYTQPIRVEPKTSILLTTEKPVYQPGQTMHVRALALDRSSHQASAGRRLSFEVEDSRGNKVFRQTAQTDPYGIASAEFSLADEVNLGTYHLRALMDEPDAAPNAAQADKAELALQVERYVLPRFKVDLDFAGKDAKAKRGYRPGDHVTGTVRSNYFFGKPVDHAEVVVKASARDVTVVDAGEVKGTTDAEGAFHFDIRLPDFFAGHPLNQGVALALIEATVKDNAGHSETHGETVTVSESPLLITAFPEGGALVPGLENQVFIVASYPDGTPAQAAIRAGVTGHADETAATDASGVAVIHFPGDAGTTQMNIEAKDREGNRVSVPVSLQSRDGSSQILLHTDKALYRAGEHVRLRVWSTKEKGSAYVDVVKDGQTIATHDLDIANGRAELDLTVTPDMAGTLAINAYTFGRDERPVGDHRLVFVQPADELRVETQVDLPVYKPGSEARIGFRVTNNKGEGVQAALGVEVVDQAVFALAEKQPGFAKVFFYLEQEAMKPRYEIHSIGLPDVISSAQPAQRDLAARALFSATETATLNNAALEFGREVPQEKFAVYAARYRQRFHDQAVRLTEALERADDAGQDACTQAGVSARLAEMKLTDAWGNNLHVDERNWNARSLNVRSAGPDGRLFGADDLVEALEDSWCGLYGSGAAIRVSLARDSRSGPSAINGTVLDPAGAGIPGATVKITERGNGRTHTLKAGPSGDFFLGSLSAGRHRIEIVVPGFQRAEKEFSLGDHDLAAISVAMQLGAMAQAITIAGEASLLKTESGEISHLVRTSPMAALPVMARFAVAPSAQPAPAPAAETHVRSWFPESLYVAPQIITGADGRASITIPIADNITTWRMAMLASTKQGALGSGTSSLKVFQDFFTEMDLPVTLTQGDEVSIPVGIYNYSGSRGNVRLHLDQADWFSSEGDNPEKNLAVESDRVGSAQFTVAAKRIGKFKLTLRAEMDGQAKRADIVVREIEVVPNGREQTMVFNGRLDSVIHHDVNFPTAAIPEAGTVFVRLYPGPLSQVVEGMDTLLRMPYGCFEQTSSSTYPNVLALDYMKRMKKAAPEVSAKAEGYIASGYQRLLTFEVQGGGFSWFGSAPANKILTSYGLMEFSDMSKVHDVDARVIQRTQQWLASQQQPDGSWRPDASFINEGATNRFNSDVLRITAYIAWSLEVTGYQGPAVANALRFIESRLNANSKPDVYTLAVLANFATDYAKAPAFTGQVMQLLLDARTEQNDQVWWSAAETSMYATGTSAAVETTGLAVQALLKSGSNSAVVSKAMNYIVSKKDAAGAWGSTQATIMALRALLLSTEKGGATAKGAVEVLLNGKVAGKLALTAGNNDLLHQFAFKTVDSQSTNAVEIRFTGEGSLAYQVAGRYFVPWNERPAGEPLSIDVHYDRTRLAQDEIASATATVRNNLPTSANMVMVDLGIPPGFDLLSEDLDTYREKSAGLKSGRLEKFTVTPTQAILYFDSIAPSARLSLSFRLRAKYPIRARTFQSRVYEYYSPDVNSLAAPVQLEVRKR